MEWEERAGAFQKLLEFPETPEFQEKLQQALNASDKELSALAEQLAYQRFFAPPQNLPPALQDALVFYLQQTGEEKEKLLTELFESIHAQALPFLLKIVEYDSTPEAQKSAYRLIQSSLLEEDPQILQTFVEQGQSTYWRHWFRGEVSLRLGAFEEAKRDFLQAYHELNSFFTKNPPKMDNPFPLNYKLLENITCNLALLYASSDEMEIAKSYFIYLPSSSFLLTEFALGILEHPQHEFPDFWRMIRKLHDEKYLEKLALLFFFHPQHQSFFLPYIHELQNHFPHNAFFWGLEWSYLEASETTEAQQEEFLRRFPFQKFHKDFPFSLLKALKEFKARFESPNSLQTPPPPFLEEDPGALQEWEKNQQILLLWNSGKKEECLTALASTSPVSPLFWELLLQESSLIPYLEKLPVPVLVEFIRDYGWKKPKFLEEALASTSRDVLFVSLTQLGFHQTPERVLLPFLRAKDPYVRKAAILALAKCPSPDVYQAFLSLLQEDSLWKDPQQYFVAYALLESLQFFEREEALEKLLVPYLHSENEIFRKYAVGLLSPEQSLAFLQDPSEQVQEIVLKKLEQNPRKEWIPALIAYLPEGNEDQIQDLLEWFSAWPEMRSDLEPALKARLETEEDPLIRLQIHGVLFWWGDEESLKLLLEGLREEEYQIQYVALQYLGTFLEKDPSFFKELEPALRSKEAEIRQLLALHLKGITDPQAIQWLKQLIQDPQPFVSYQALDSLEFLEDPALDFALHFGYRRLLERYPDQILFLNAWARFLFKKQKNYRALTEAQWSLRWNPESLEAHETYLLLAQHLNRPQEVKREYQWLKDYYQKKFLESPQNPLWMNNFAWTLASASVELETALYWIDQALLLSSDPHFLDTKAEILWKLGHKEEACRFLEDALKQNPPLPLYYQRRLQKMKE
jgi:HEAT repeat protein